MAVTKKSLELQIADKGAEFEVQAKYIAKELAELLLPALAKILGGRVIG